MSAEHVPRYGKADVAFAGAELRDAWLLIGSVFAGMALGSVLGWAAYVGLPVLGYFGTRVYIEWKGRHLPGYFTALLYRLGVGGYSTALDRKLKRFIGDARVVNPAALRMGAIARADVHEAATDAAGVPIDTAASSAETGAGQPIN
jgi:hypothetical protein